MATAVESTSSSVDLGSGDPDWPALLDQALTVPGRLGNTYCRFYNYSFLNQIRLMQQGVFEPCASFSAWKALGRSPVKGGGRYVLHPRFYNKTDEETGETVRRLGGFKPKRTAFPYSMTVGEELQWPELPEWELQKALVALEVSQVTFDLIDANTQGYSIGRRFAINPLAKYPMKTTLHELGHIVLGHTADCEGEHMPCSRGIREFQAESVAYLLAHELELCAWDAAESRQYIQDWIGAQDLHDSHIRSVFAAVNTILVAGRGGSANSSANVSDPDESGIEAA